MDFLSQNMHTIVTAAVVLIILFVLLGIWRAFSPRVSGGRRGQRLGISEYYEVDKLRRLVLVRRDNVEHLILIGGPQDMVIESGIGAFTIPSSQGASPNQAEASTTSPAAGTARPAPRPSVYVERKAPPLRAGDAPAAPPRQEPEL